MDRVAQTQCMRHEHCASLTSNVIYFRPTLWRRSSIFTVCKVGTFWTPPLQRRWSPAEVVTGTVFTAGEVVFTGFCGDYLNIGMQHLFSYGFLQVLGSEYYFRSKTADATSICEIRITSLVVITFRRWRYFISHSSWAEQYGVMTSDGYTHTQINRLRLVSN